eukprot:scaffold195286_cov30-Tisochrysis_lutea.AAC.1
MHISDVHFMHKSSARHTTPRDDLSELSRSSSTFSLPNNVQKAVKLTTSPAASTASASSSAVWAGSQSAFAVVDTRSCAASRRPATLPYTTSDDADGLDLSYTLLAAWASIRARRSARSRTCDMCSR